MAKVGTLRCSTHIGHSCVGGLAGSAANAALTKWPILVQQFWRSSSWK